MAVNLATTKGLSCDSPTSGWSMNLDHALVNYGWFLQYNAVAVTVSGIKHNLSYNS